MGLGQVMSDNFMLEQTRYV